MENSWIVTPDLYLSMFGLFAAIMVARELVHIVRLRQARFSSRQLHRPISPGKYIKLVK